ncbi:MULTISPECIES: hypothetical protein [unclassified Modestobacter]
MTRVPPRRPGRRATRRGIVVSAAGALVLATALLWQTAYAGFSDQTTALDASVGTGTVALTSNVEGIAVSVTLPDLRPGDTASQCIVVTSTGSVPAEVRLYGRNVTGSTSLMNQIDLSWSAGTGGGGNGSCAGFSRVGETWSTTMSSFPRGYGSGALAWTTAGSVTGERRTYQLTYTFRGDAPASVKGARAGITFVWEAQST